jgi:putative YpdA family bacillithiol system oxidoreductase
MTISFRGFLPRLKGFQQEQRPILKNHQSSVQGVFMCGDLAGEPLMKTSAKNALEAVNSIDSFLRLKQLDCDCSDIVICGAGVAGMAAAVEAKKRGLTVTLIEKSKTLQTILDFPEAKHIYANPQTLKLDSPFNVEDCSKEEFLEYTGKVIEEYNLEILEGESIAGIEKANDGSIIVISESGNQFRGKSVLLSMGRRGNPRKLNIPGEELNKVHHSLLIPQGYSGRNIVVIGGGNSAVEAAMALCSDGAKVTISYRKEGFFRISKENRKLLKAYLDEKRIEVVYNSNPTAINEEGVVLSAGSEEQKLEADDIFILAGAESPNKLLESLGLKIENTWSSRRISGFIVSVFLVWLFYSFSKWGDGSSIKEFPFSLLGKRWEVIPNINPVYVKGLIYSLVVIGFGIPALKRWRSYPRNREYQTLRYITVFVSQAFFLFIFPEFILTQVDPSNAWRFYGLVMPFPLIFETFFGSPTTWIIICSLMTFLVLPIFIYYHGKKLCSWICGCGCLAETLGDNYRHYAPQGENSRKIENYLLWPVLVWAFLSAGIYIFVRGNEGAYTADIELYLYLVDFILASVVGVAFYFFFGGRVWCRYFCPLSHYMRLLSAWFSKFKIRPLDKCIACAECSRYCQMGIDVMQFALKEENVTNKNSSCIGCGVCVSVCPMDNLKMGDIPKPLL